MAQDILSLETCLVFFQDLVCQVQPQSRSSGKQTFFFEQVLAFIVVSKGKARQGKVKSLE